jgi:hypothetical protein
MTAAPAPPTRLVRRAPAVRDQETLLRTPTICVGVQPDGHIEPPDAGAALAPRPPALSLDTRGQGPALAPWRARRDQSP